MNVINESTIQRHTVSGDSVHDLFELLRVSTFRHPNALAIDFMGRKLTYRDVFQAVEHVAGGLKDIGVARGDRVALSLPNTPYSVIFFFAVQRVGGIVVNLNPLYVQHEVHQILKTADVSVLVMSDIAAIAEPAYRAAENTAVRRVVVCPFAHALPPVKSTLFKVLKSKEIYHFPTDKRIVTYDTLAHSKTVAKHVTIDPLHDVAVLQFTGGTTGIPKAAKLTHGNLLANIEQIKDMAQDALRDPPTTLGILPLFHVFALMAVMLLTIDRGGEIVLLPRFETGSTIATMRRVRISLLPTVPTIQTALLRDPDLSADLFTHMRAIISGGAPLPVALRKRFEETARCPVIEGYGLSETSPVLTLNPLHGVRDGSCGKVVIHTDLQIRSLDDITRRLPVMEKGEVCVKGPQVMSGYWKNEENATAFTPDGYFRTGDVGYLDEDGYLFLVDRLKDIIICGGYNVYPHIIEDALYRHPAVLETIVIGVSDPYRGQSPKAFVTLRPGSTVTPAELATHLEQFVSKIERPREIVLRDALPKTLIGKLSRKDLKIQEGITD